MGFDNEDNFRNLIGGAFGQVEAAVGPEAYQAHTDVQKSIAEFNRAQVKVMEAQVEHTKAQIEMGVALSQAQIEQQKARTAAFKSMAAVVLMAVLLALVGVVLPFCWIMWSHV